MHAQTKTPRSFAFTRNQKPDMAGKAKEAGNERGGVWDEGRVTTVSTGKSELYKIHQ